MLGSIADGRSTIRGFLRGEDCIATMLAMRQLGVSVEEVGDEVLIDGVGLHGLQAPQRPLDLGNSGTALRLLAGLLAPQPFDSELTGDASLRSRPMERVAKPLRLMGADIAATNGRPPLKIRGGRRLHGVEYALPVASAQVKSAILLASLYAAGSTTVTSPDLTRDHTERMLVAMGVPVDVDAGGKRVMVAETRKLSSVDIDVPGDFSSAAFFIVAACIGASEGLVIENVGINATRTGLLEILRLMGASIELRNVRTSGSEPVADLLVSQSELHGVDVPPGLVALSIDEFPALFVAAAAARGTTRVTGAAELRHKESDRLSVMATALDELGIELVETPDGMIVHGGTLKGGVVDSHGDHRVAMALAVSSLRADAPIEIQNAAQVVTSFPNFVELGVAVGLDLDMAEAGNL